jgi:hypothetical protein
MTPQLQAHRSTPAATRHTLIFLRQRGHGPAAAGTSADGRRHTLIFLRQRGHGPATAGTSAEDGSGE